MPAPARAALPAAPLAPPPLPAWAAAAAASARATGRWWCGWWRRWSCPLQSQGAGGEREGLAWGRGGARKAACLGFAQSVWRAQRGMQPAAQAFRTPLEAASNPNSPVTLPRSRARTRRLVGRALKVEAAHNHGRGRHRLQQRKLVACAGVTKQGWHSCSEGISTNRWATVPVRQQALVLRRPHCSRRFLCCTVLGSPRLTSLWQRITGSPMHLRLPPPKGRYLKSWVASLGTGWSTGKRSGLKTSASSHSSGELHKRGRIADGQ